MDEATKSYKECRECNTSGYVLRLQWKDFYPGGNGNGRWYDDHVCLGCGRYVDQSVNLCHDSLIEYRKKYGNVVGYPKVDKERKH